ncbi:MAG: glycine cleavage system protein H [Verrucomicrobiae bacterium]|nr:glycine cleavage system protein H [Verrucomicrobiae bacterium]
MSETGDLQRIVTDHGDSISYRRCKFSTMLPKAYRYTAGHHWLAEIAPGLWRVGLTRFALRMLGDFVEMHLHVQPGSRVHVGDEIGWYEGLKARTDLFCVAEGVFERGNPGLSDPREDPYGAGWLYEVRGNPDPQSFDAQAYIALLDATIDKLQQDD